METSQSLPCLWAKTPAETSRTIRLGDFCGELPSRAPRAILSGTSSFLTVPAKGHTFFQLFLSVEQKSCLWKVSSTFVSLYPRLVQLSDLSREVSLCRGRGYQRDQTSQGAHRATVLSSSTLSPRSSGTITEVGSAEGLSELEL